MSHLPHGYLNAVCGVLEELLQSLDLFCGERSREDGLLLDEAAAVPP